MPSLSAIDEAYIEAEPLDIYELIADYNAMNSWFPKCKCTVLDGKKIAKGCRVKHEVGEKRVFSRFTRRIDKIKKGRRIEESYIAGDILGTGIWTFTPEGTGTRIAYDCKVKGNSFMSNFGILLTRSKAHSAFYQDLFKHLKAHAEK